jgi:2-polyprenyl-3-methyl-5-hydroxy-6-metoxy-1,4-benzoquinol methylase
VDFDTAASSWDEDEQRVRRGRAIAEEIRSRLGDRTHHRALDFGAGTGALSLLLADRFDEILLVDTSAGMLAEAAAKITAAGLNLAARIRPLAIDLTGDDPTGWPEPGSIDVVYTSMALHHVTDVADLLRTFHALLVPGGLLFVADLAADEDGGYHAHEESFEGHHGFGRADIEAALTGSGFAPASVGTVFVVHREGRDYPVFLAVARRVP